MESSLKKMNTLVSKVMPGARIEKTVLPQCDEISLYLLGSEYPGSIMGKEDGRRLMAEPMFWLFCWASGQAMARYLLDNPKKVMGKRVLDFGCGSGVAGIAAAKAGAEKVWACDSDPCAVQAAMENCRLNSVSIEMIDDWKTLSPVPDIILAADVLYDPENMPLLDEFTTVAPEVLVADSRVKNFDVPSYRKIGQLDSFTVPDLGEPDENRIVNFYYAGP